jgi:EAL domain-containing protein (putative c-di-GMP-specific phosphodiesterase class I)
MIKRILILDDEKTVLDVLADYLHEPQQEIFLCNDIEAAETLLEQKTFHVVVTDLRVSELGGLEGMRLIRYVATHFPEATIVAMSGYVNDDVRALGQQLGASMVLEKPLDLHLLKKLIQDSLVPIDPDEPPVNHESIAWKEGIEHSIEPLETFLKRHVIRSVLQPIVSCKNTAKPWSVHAWEALARAPQGSLYSNPEFLFGYASHKNSLFETDMQCIRAALLAFVHTPTSASQYSKLFLNVHPRSLSHSLFQEHIQNLLEEHKIATHQVVFELTEQQTILNTKAFARTLAALRQAHFLIALDDFGMGFANLRLVQDLQPDYLKMSGYFCRSIDQDQSKRTIVSHIQKLCNDLRIPMVMESVETLAEFECIQNLGIPLAQGYYISRPQETQQIKEKAHEFISEIVHPLHNSSENTL